MAVLGISRLRLSTLPLLLLAAVVSVCPPAFAQETIEPDVKAAFIYNFTRFVEWPASALQAPRINICIVGDPAVGAALDGIIAGEEAYGRPLARLDPATVNDAGRCHILYLGRGAPDGGSRMLAAVRQLPVLTVGDASSFHARGGVIQFALVDGKVRFDISLPAADRSGLVVSSRLIRVARHIVERTQ